MNRLSIYFILCVLVFPISESMSQEAEKTRDIEDIQPGIREQ